MSQLIIKILLFHTASASIDKKYRKFVVLYVDCVASASVCDNSNIASDWCDVFNDWCITLYVTK